MTELNIAQRLGALKVNKSPVIILGMHRSGTSMVTESLQKLGLFVGSKLDQNFESFFFMQLNNWMLQEVHGGWCNPENIDLILGRPEVKELVAQLMKRLLNSPKIIDYVGLLNFIYGCVPGKMSESWGWKDPRNTFTLPIWLDLFPQAKLIHIYRNGVDVAASLNVRAKKQVSFSRNWVEQAKWFELVKKVQRKTPVLNGSARCLSLHESFVMWEEHLARAFSLMEKLPNEKINIRYEDFVSNPDIFLKKLGEFCGLTFSQERLDGVVSSIKKDRALAWKRNPQVGEFYKEKKDSYWMKQLGYSTDSEQQVKV